MVVRNEGKWSLYRHTSPIGKVYIGITSVKPQRRWGYGCNYKRCYLLDRAIKKYGWDNIKHEVLFTGLSEHHAKNLEIDLIKHYKKLNISYNITDGGDGVIGVPDSPKRIEAVRKYWTGRHLTEEAKRKISEANKGNQATKGMHWSKESIAKMIATRKKNGMKRHISKEKLSEIRRTTAKCIPVYQYNLDGTFVAKYFSMKEAQRKTGTHANNISMCCSGTIRQANNYIWRKAL